MLRIYHKENVVSYPWIKNVDYDEFIHSKKQNFDFDEYFFVSPTINGCSLTAEITKNKGEKVTEEDLNNAFATSLVVAMTGFDFNSETSQNYFVSLPPEFYTKTTFSTVCEKMESFMQQAPKFDRPRLEKNLWLFQDFAYKLDKEEFPAPHPLQGNNTNFSK